MHASPGRSFEFGPYRLDVGERLLVRGGESIRLTPKAFDTLAMLVCRHGHLVTKDELLQALWPDAHVEENNLAQYISLLRHTLADEADTAYIETVPRTGYRFVAPVREGTSPTTVTPTRAAGGPAPTRPAAPTLPVVARRYARGLSFVAAMAVLAVLAAVLPMRSLASRSAVGSMVVLPFDTDSTEATAEGLPLTLAAELTQDLARSGHERVLPVSRVYRYVGEHTRVDPREAARASGAGVVLSGRVEVANEKPERVQAVLTRVADGRELWAETIEVPAGSIRSVEEHIAAAADLALGWPRPPARTSAASPFDADEAYVMGRYLWSTRVPEDLYRSTELLERAVAQAPEVAEFHAALADAYAFDIVNWPKGEREAHAALAIDGRLGAPHATLGLIQFFWRRDLAATENELRTAIRLEPSYATAHEWYGLMQASYGESSGAYAEIQEARRLDPSSVAILADECQIEYLARDYDRALGACDEAIRLAPSRLSAHRTRLAILEQLAMSADAFQEYSTICALGRGSPCAFVRSAGLLQPDSRRDLPTFWRGESEAYKGKPDAVTSPLRVATVYARLGNKEAALTTLKRLVGSTDLDALFVYRDPAFEALLPDPRFRALYYRFFSNAGAPQTIGPTRWR